MKHFDPLYKLDSKGKLRVWLISVDGNQIITTHGLLDGQQQTDVETIRDGKNVGRANATTPEQQALAEAKAEHEKKIARGGYTPDRAKAEGGGNDQAGGIQPMLAKSWEDVEKKFKFPCAGQAKLDGVRCIAIWDGSKVTLWSRKCEAVVVPVPHVIAALEKQLAGKPPIILDGELFRLGWSLQTIASFTRQKKAPKPGYEEIGYHIYDVVENAPFSTRTCLVDEALKHSDGHPLYKVVTDWVHNLAQAKELHNELVEAGHEGLILRSWDAPYQKGKRSSDLVKYKLFQDAEFEIVAVSEGRGKFEGKAIFTCITKEGKTFDCCAPGNMEDRARYFQEADKLIGKMLTVKFFDWTDDGLPHFPVGKCLRDYE